MLQFIRERAQGWIAWVIIGVLSFTFMLWGVQNYSGRNTDANVLAKVNGVPITRHAAQKQTLQQLITSEVLSQANTQDGFHLSPRLLGEAVISMPYFQKEGQFSNERYEGVLARMGYSKEGFLAELEQTILLSQIKLGILKSSLVFPNEVTDLWKLSHQKYDISYLIIPTEKAVVSEAEMRQYYQANAEQFKKPEKVSLEYLVLSADKKSEQSYAQAVEQLAELSYTHPDSLSEVARTLALPIQHTELFTREGGAPHTLTANPKIIAAAFSDDVLVHRNNSAPITLDDDHVVVLRIKQYEPAFLRPLAEVRETIANLLSTELSQKQTEALSKQMLSDLQNAKVSPADIAQRYHLTWNKKINQTLNTSASFSASPVDENHFMLVKVDAVHLDNKKPSPEVSQKMAEQLEKTYAQAEYELYIKSKMDKAKIVQNVKLPSIKKE